MVYPAVFIALRRGGGVRARRKRRRRGPGNQVLPISLRQRFDSRSFAHVFQLYGSFLLRAVARTNCALAAAAQTPRCLLVSLLHASVDRP